MVDSLYICGNIIIEEMLLELTRSAIFLYFTNIITVLLFRHFSNLFYYLSLPLPFPKRYRLEKGHNMLDLCSYS